MAQPSSHCVGRRLSFDGALCTVRYIGEVAGTNGTWLGVEWDDATRGKHDGSHKGTRYFTCMPFRGTISSAVLSTNHWRLGISKSHTAASFVRPKRPADKPQSFIGALHEKYASDGDGVDPDAGVVIFGTKVAQEMGFDKIRRKLAQVEDLTVVILDGLRVASARDDNEPAIAERCPSITQLDLGRNLFESLAPVVEICGELQNLRTLRLR